MVDCAAKQIKGQKVFLRQKDVGDAARDYGWRCDQELARYDATRPLRVSLRDFLADYEADLRRAAMHGQRFAIETFEGKHIGNCMYYGVDNYRRDTELGILIGDRDYWGKGYGTDAVRTLLHHIFHCTSLTRVYLRTLDWNIRAQRSFTRCGFREYRRQRDGQYQFAVMEICRDEFIALEAREAMEE